MTYVIKDVKSGEYFARHTTRSGWYHPDIERARLYTMYVLAASTIEAGEHHVAWPGDRKLKVVKVTITEGAGR